MTTRQNGIGHGSCGTTMAPGASDHDDAPHARPATGRRIGRWACCIALGCCGFLPALAARAAADADCQGHSRGHPNCGGHNMMLVGEQAAYLSHLPMFQAPHQFQVILETTFEKGGKAVTQRYVDDRRQHANVRMYTVEPAELFVLPRLWTSEGPRRSAFRAAVYRGHLERDGKQITGLAGIDVKVTRVVYARELPAEKRLDTLGYVLFGKGQELFLAHQLSQAPDFDQILAVETDGHPWTEAELRQGVTIMIPDRQNVATGRIREGDTVAGQGQITGAPAAFDIRIRAKRELYFEEGELLKIPKFEQTDEEKKAGF